MSTQAHTPGPWSYTFRPGEYSEGEVSADNGKSTIAIVAGQNYGQWRDVDDNGDAEFKANARLIAAAPDMLAALKNMIWLAENPPSQGEFHDARVRIESARAAIAKAEGRS